MVKCLHCKQNCVLMRGYEVYPSNKKLANKHYYVCGPCGSIGGCKPGTTEARGIPANSHVRSLRQKCHNVAAAYATEFKKNFKNVVINTLHAVNHKSLSSMDERGCEEFIDIIRILRKEGSKPVITRPVLEEPKHPCKCAHCGELCKMTRGHYFHPGVFHEKNKIYYYCEPCQALARSKNGVPLETAANEQLRNLRSECSTKLSSMAKKYRVSEGEIARDFFSLPLESPVGSYTLPMCKAVLS